MKVTVDFDCTPEEARRFLGLPDLTDLHAIYLGKMTRLVEEGVTPDMVEVMMRNWGPMGEASMNLWRQLVDQMTKAGTGRS